MNLRYIFFAALLVVLGAGLFFLPEKTNTNEMAPEKLHAELFDQTRYVSTDEVAERIINQDPSLFLIDVRTADYYAEYSLPGAANIPLEDLLSPNWEDYLTQEYMDVVFFSNGDIYAEQAWMLANRMGYKNFYIMKGGLNCWFETIIKPVKPESTASNNEFDLYKFRNGASQYFTGGELILSEEIVAEAITVTRKKKKTVASGGC